MHSPFFCLSYRGDDGLALSNPPFRLEVRFSNYDNANECTVSFTNQLTVRLPHTLHDVVQQSPQVQAYLASHGDADYDDWVIHVNVRLYNADGLVSGEIMSKNIRALYPRSQPRP